MKKTSNILWGLVFIIVGLILGLNAFGITNINIFFSGWWTLFIIVPCFIGLFRETEKTGNIIGLVIGICLLLCCQDVINFKNIFKDSINSKITKEIKKLNENKTGDNEYCATFAGQNINFDNQEFHGADLTAVFGGVKCDIRKAIIEGDQVINATSIFGGIEIYAPTNVKIQVKSTPIFGGISNKVSNINKDDAHTIYVNATCVFGGVEIK